MSTPAAKFCEFFVRWAAVSGALGPLGLPPASAGRRGGGRPGGQQGGKRVLAPPWCGKF